jgi:pectinesterase
MSTRVPLLLIILLFVLSLYTQAQVASAAVPVKSVARIETFLVPVRLTVASDGSGDHSTIQAAVMAVRDFMQVPATIYIKNSTYHEKLLAPSQKPISPF